LEGKNATLTEESAVILGKYITQSDEVTNAYKEIKEKDQLLYVLKEKLKTFREDEAGVRPVFQEKLEYLNAQICEHQHQNSTLMHMIQRLEFDKKSSLSANNQHMQHYLDELQRWKQKHDYLLIKFLMPELNADSDGNIFNIISNEYIDDFEKLKKSYFDAILRLHSVILSQKLKINDSALVLDIGSMYENKVKNLSWREFEKFIEIQISILSLKQQVDSKRSSVGLPEGTYSKRKTIGTNYNMI